MISASGSARRAAHRLLQINFILPLVQVPLVSYAVYLSNSIVILADALGVYINVLQMGLVWIVYVAYREQFRTSDSPIVRSFKALIPIYILNNLVVLTPIVLGTFSGLQAFALYADPVGAFVLVAFSWVMIYGLATRSVTCLIDRAVDEEVQLLIMRMLAEHFDRFDTVHDIRTRAVGDRVRPGDAGGRAGGRDPQHGGPGRRPGAEVEAAGLTGSRPGAGRRLSVTPKAGSRTPPPPRTGSRTGSGRNRASRGRRKCLSRAAGRG